MKDNRITFSYSERSGRSKITITPAEAVEVEEGTFERVDLQSDVVRVAIYFKKELNDNTSIDAQVASVQNFIFSDSVFQVRRCNEDEYMITANISSCEVGRLEELSNVSHVSVLEAAEVKKKETSTVQEMPSAELEMKASKVEERSSEAVSLATTEVAETIVEVTTEESTQDIQTNPTISYQVEYVEHTVSATVQDVSELATDVEVSSEMGQSYEEQTSIHSTGIMIPVIMIVGIVVFLGYKLGKKWVQSKK